MQHNNQTLNWDMFKENKTDQKTISFFVENVPVNTLKWHYVLQFFK